MNTKRVFLTGASSGIGRAIANRLLNEGCQVWGTSRDSARLPVHGNFHPLELDLREIDSIQSGVHMALTEGGTFDVLINNAGHAIYAPLEELSADEMRTQVELMVIAPMELVRLLLPGMRAKGKGLIVNVTSLAGMFPIPYMGTYNACKAALSALSWTLALELCREPIRVVDLRPGDIRTGFHQAMQCHVSLDSADSDENIARAFQAYSQRMERAPSPARVARCVSDLLNAEGNRPSRLNVGSLFQTRIAPILSSLSPWTWTHYFLTKYYRLNCQRSWYKHRNR